MSVKERYQNPVVGDTVRLRMFTYNRNNLADVVEIEKVEVYFLDPENKSAENPDGRRLVQSYDGTSVETSDTGTHLLTVEVTDPRYTIGTYLDVWHVRFLEDGPITTVQNVFQVFPQQWYTTPIPVVYDFTFHFQPNKLRQGTKQYLIIEVVPNVPTAGDLRKYYENIAIAADLEISIQQRCGDCLPQESDLRTIVENEPITFREKRFAYYQLDTQDLDCGIYDVWFRMDFGGNTYVSDRMQLLIYD